MLWPFIDFGVYLGGHLLCYLDSYSGFTHLDTPEIILMYLVELPIPENLYFANNFLQLSAI